MCVVLLCFFELINWGVYQTPVIKCFCFKEQEEDGEGMKEMMNHWVIADDAELASVTPE